MAVNNNSNDIHDALFEILELIAVGIMDRRYEDESDDENIIRVVTCLLSSIGMDTASSGDVQSPGSEPEETTLIPDDANKDYFEESSVLHSELPSVDALSLAKSEPAAPIPEQHHSATRSKKTTVPKIHLLFRTISLYQLAVMRSRMVTRLLRSWGLSTQLLLCAAGQGIFSCDG